MGTRSETYPYPFSIYKWIDGTSINLITLNDKTIEQLASDLSNFLKQLQNITKVSGPEVNYLRPGQHNFWRADHISVYSKDAIEQIIKLSDFIDTDKANDLWQKGCQTKWQKNQYGFMEIWQLVIY